MSLDRVPKGLQHSRRDVLIMAATAAAATTLPVVAPVALAKQVAKEGKSKMTTITTKDGTGIFFKEWGEGQPVVFHHGWPLSGDDWDTQMMFFSSKGYRVVAHDRRGHGRSSPSSHGNDMDTYAADTAAVVDHLGLKDAIHIGHSTGGGEVARYVAKYGGGGRVAKAVLIGAIPPTMLKTAANPGGTPMEVFDSIRAGVANSRAEFYWGFANGPFYGFNRPDATVSQAIAENWYRQAMVGDIKAHYDCIAAFSETDFTEDLKKIHQPVLILHGEDDQVVPIADSAQLSVKLLKNGTLKTYPGYPHGMATTHADVINADILAFLQS